MPASSITCGGFFKAYLTDRIQCVVIDSHLSKWLPVASGVPQGSILGPLLFTLYINDLPSIPSFSLPFLFADDTKCCTRILSLNDSSHLQDDLDAIHTWSLSSSLTFNTSKCCLLRFSNRSVKQISSTYFFNGDKIPLSINVVTLGSSFKVTFPGHFIMT